MLVEAVAVKIFRDGPHPTWTPHRLHQVSRKELHFVEVVPQHPVLFRCPADPTAYYVIPFVNRTWVGEAKRNYLNVQHMRGRCTYDICVRTFSKIFILCHYLSDWLHPYCPSNNINALHPQGVQLIQQLSIPPLTVPAWSYHLHRPIKKYKHRLRKSLRLLFITLMIKQISNVVDLPVQTQG